MELNDPVGILSGLVVVGGIVGLVIYDSHLTVGGALDLAVQNPLVSVPLGLVFLFLVLFGKGGGAGEA